MDLYYATTNNGKFTSLSNSLKKYDIFLKEFKEELPEPRSGIVEQIASHKVVHAYNKLEKPVMALDAGFFISSLNGFPRAYVNFVLETIGLEGILKLVEGTDRVAEFRHCLAYMDKTLEAPKCFVDSVKGRIVEKPRGVYPQPHLWSPLSQIFIPEGCDKTLAEMDANDSKEWRNSQRDPVAYYTKFAEWYLNK